MEHSITETAMTASSMVTVSLYISLEWAVILKTVQCERNIHLEFLFFFPPINDVKHKTLLWEEDSKSQDHSELADESL